MLFHNREFPDHFNSKVFAPCHKACKAPAATEASIYSFKLNLFSTDVRMPFATLDKTTRLFYDIYGGQGEELDPSKQIVLLLHPRFFDHELFAPQYTDTELREKFNLVLTGIYGPQSY
jgi:hypothetical protein